MSTITEPKSVLEIVLLLTEQKKEKNIFPAVASELQILAKAKELGLNQEQARIDLELLAFSKILTRHRNVNGVHYYQKK